MNPLPRLPLACGLCLVALAAGCEKIAQNMYDQPRYKPLAASALWPDGRASRDPVAGTIPRSEGTNAGTSSGRSGLVQPTPEVPKPVPTVAVPLAPSIQAQETSRSAWTQPLLERGRQRFDIFCAPCHSEAGDGDGMIVRRGFPRPPSFHIDRLRNASDQHLYSVITHGYGDMYSYADRVPPADRDAIVAYVRALQLSRHATLADVPADARAALEQARK